MRILAALLLTLTFISSCGDKKSPPGFQVKEEAFIGQINQKPMPSESKINLNSDKSFLNRDYPIQIALYSNGKWYYDLPNLGTGVGTYSYQDGKLKLFASRDLFDINIDIIAADQEATSFYLHFEDRFSLVTLETELIN